MAERFGRSAECSLASDLDTVRRMASRSTNALFSRRTRGQINALETGRGHRRVRKIAVAADFESFDRGTGLCGGIPQASDSVGTYTRRHIRGDCRIFSGAGAVAPSPTRRADAQTPYRRAHG